MNSLVEILNQWGGNFLNFAWPMLWQSSLLIAALFAVEFLFRRRLRASIRYALWLVVLVKLCVPPTLALPTSPVWWLHQTSPVVTKTKIPHYTVAYDQAPLLELPQAPLPAYVPPKPAMTVAARLLVSSTAISLTLLLWLLVRWWQIARQVRRAATCGRLTLALAEARSLAGIRFQPQIKLTGNSMSPAVCGLFRPAILVPQALAENFSDEQLRAVLLHELIHLRRRDVWLNFLQALLQIAYWWHPLVWLANARIRRVREEAVDDAVMLALRDEAESYAPTLLEVAKLALNRPLVSLGLVGILESRHSLRQRIERLVDFRPPRQAGLTLVSLLGILAFTAVAVPMGSAPMSLGNQPEINGTSGRQQSLTLKVNPGIFIRNIKVQAANSMLSATNDYTDILVEILRGECLDCVPPHGIAFNIKTGEITTENAPEKLEVFRRVIGQLNRADGKCELPLPNNPLREKVVIDARIYPMSEGEFEKSTSSLRRYSGGSFGDVWWSVPPEKFKRFVSDIEDSGIRAVQRPRIQTSSGKTAEFYVGDQTNSFDLACKPFVEKGFVDLMLQGTVISDELGNTFTNHFFSKPSAEDHGGMVLRVRNYGGLAGSNLVVVIGVEIITNTQSAVYKSGRIPAVVGPAIGPDGVDTAKLLANENVEKTTPLTVKSAVAVPQIHIKARFVEVPEAFFDDASGTFLSGTIPNSFPAGVTNGIGILTASEAKGFLQQLELQKGSEILAEPEVTTTSGRQTQMRATQIITVITNAVFEKNSTNLAGSISYQAGQMEAGPVLDTVTKVLPDGYTIDLRTIASLATFYGYATQPTNMPPHSVTNSAGEIVDLPVVLPVVQVSRAEAHATLFDGQTLILFPKAEKPVSFNPDKKTDELLLGQVRQAEMKSGNKQLVVLVTVDIVDPAGNRIHTDDEMPFAQKGIPPQSPQPR